MKIKTNADTLTVTIGELLEGTVFTYQNATYIRGARVVSGLGRVHCTMLTNGYRHELDASFRVTRHPDAVLCLN